MVQFKGMQSCPKKRIQHLLIVAVILSAFSIAALTFCTLRFPISLEAKFKRQFSVFSGGEMETGEEKGSKEMKYPRITHRELIEATGGFSSSSLIGSGQFGHVYKGLLQDNTRIAVKVLDSRTKADISGSFKRECQVFKRQLHS